MGPDRSRRTILDEAPPKSIALDELLVIPFVAVSMVGAPSTVLVAARILAAAVAVVSTGEDVLIPHSARRTTPFVAFISTLNVLVRIVVSVVFTGLLTGIDGAGVGIGRFGDGRRSRGNSQDEHYGRNERSHGCWERRKMNV